MFQLGVGFSRNVVTILILRFLGGMFAASPLTNVGCVSSINRTLSYSYLVFSALISDIWDARTRGKAMAIFTLAPFAGPALGPTVAGYLTVAGLRWQWTFWILAVFVSPLSSLILGCRTNYIPLGGYLLASNRFHNS